MILLPNRDRQILWLQEASDEGWYVLESAEPELLNYIRLIYGEDNETIEAVDPPGGPFMCLGYIASGFMVTEIKVTSLGVYVKLREVENDKEEAGD